MLFFFFTFLLNHFFADTILYNIRFSHNKDSGMKIREMIISLAVYIGFQEVVVSISSELNMGRRQISLLQKDKNFNLKKDSI